MHLHRQRASRPDSTASAVSGCRVCASLGAAGAADGAADGAAADDRLAAMGVARWGAGHAGSFMRFS
jgi:hypothetical protein